MHAGGPVAQDKCNLEVNVMYIPVELLSEKP